MDDATRKFDQWALIEIMGHRRLAGRVTEDTIAGVALLRVDVPDIEGEPAWTTWIGASAIFSLSPVSEEVCRAHAKSFRASPVMVWEIKRQLLAAPAGDPADDEWDDDDIPM